MSVEIGEEPIGRLPQHAEVPIGFLVERVLEVTAVDGGLGGLTSSEVLVDEPWTKDYDAIEGDRPTAWPKRFDVANWGLLAAHDGGRRVGGAVVAFDTPDVHMLEGRSDLAVLWDIRVHPDARSAGTGTALFRAVEAWAGERGCRAVKIETQNVNVPACTFYRRMGCTLGAINRFAYADLPDEVQLLWFKEL